ncbi:MAG: hypothetical protein Tsb0020_15000 [Haliangiales bacterium]
MVTEPRQIDVIAILGPSYCGSTLLSYVLNTDDELFGGSELRRLVERNDTVVCDICGPQCRIWTRENIDQFAGSDGKAQFYQRIAAIVNKSLIVDSSKIHTFFSDDFIAEQESQGVRFSFLLPLKHPLRLFASYVYNDFFRKRGHRASNYDEVRSALSGPLRDEVMNTFLPAAAERCFRLYNVFFKRFVRSPEMSTFTLKHEEFVRPNGVKLLEEIVTKATGYAPSLDCENFSAYEAHPIGGNRGPYWQTRLQRDQNFSSSDARFKYYREKRGAQLDEKYRLVFTSDMLKEIESWEITQKLSSLLMYDDDSNALAAPG